jgi:hypothetical protein
MTKELTQAGGRHLISKTLLGGPSLSAVHGERVGLLFASLLTPGSSISIPQSVACRG